MKDRKNRTHWMLAVAVAGAMLGVGSVSFGQYRVGDDGRARDANNRIGSGGYNDRGPTNPYAVSGNQIVTGNVTGGREFRGFVPYTDPGAFRGNVAGTNIDQFVRQSAGVPTGVFNNNNAQNVTQFYGDSRAAPPPAGFVQQAPGSNAFVPGPPQTRTSGDIRMGNPFDTFQIQQPRAGQLVMPGPIDPSSQAQTVITASPLYGVRMWKFGDPASEQFLTDYTDVYASSRRGALLDNATLDRMRSELQVDGSVAGRTGDLSRPGASALENNNINDRTTIDPNPANINDLNRPLDRPLDSGQGGPENSPLNSGVTNDPLSSNIGSNTQGVRHRMLAQTPSAARNSRQYQQLQDRLQQYQQNRGQMADMQANQQFQAERRAAAQAQRNPNDPLPPGQVNSTVPGMPQPGGTPGSTPGMPQPGMPQPGMPGTQQPTDATGASIPGMPGTAAPGTGIPDTGAPGMGDTGTAGAATPTLPPHPGNAGNREKPLLITSFSKDMKDSQVTGLMKEAEDLMKAGKYTTALERYDVVDQVAPNDPLVLLGRATAELGASYYTRADSHLRQAFSQDSALLMGQYDLHAFLGDERLRILVSDLKDLANRNKADVRPVFLLAYIAYNTGNERNAAAYLDLAEKRAGGKDPFFKLLRDHWALPQDVAPIEGDMNK